MTVQESSVDELFQGEDIQGPPDELRSFTKSLEEPKESERRAAERHRFHKPIPVVPVDEQVQPGASGMLLYSRNVSTSGIAFVHTEPIEQSHLAVQLTGIHGERMQILVKILRCTPVGDFFEIAGQYVRRLN